MATHPASDSDPQPGPDEPLEGSAGLLDPLEVVRREVVLDAVLGDVWAQFEGPDGLSGWLADEVDVEVRSGAEGTVRDADGPERPVRVEEVVPGRRLGLRWRDVGDRPTLVEIGLEPLDRGRTRVVVVEVPVAVLSLVAPAVDRVLAVAAPGGGASRGGAASARAGARVLAGAR